MYVKVYSESGEYIMLVHQTAAQISNVIKYSNENNQNLVIIRSIDGHPCPCSYKGEKTDVSIMLALKEERDKPEGNHETFIRTIDLYDGLCIIFPVVLFLVTILH